MYFLFYAYFSSTTTTTSPPNCANNNNNNYNNCNINSPKQIPKTKHQTVQNATCKHNYNLQPTTYNEYNNNNNNNHNYNNNQLYTPYIVGYTMRDIRYKWNEGPNSVGVSSEVSLPQFKVLGHRQRAMEISLTTGTCRRLPIFFQTLLLPIYIYDNTDDDLSIYNNYI